MNTLSKQHGIALLTVLMVVVLATIAAVAMTSRQQIDIRRTENIFHKDQIDHYLLWAEDFGRQFLSLDFKNSNIDNLDEDWAKAGRSGNPLLDIIRIDEAEITGTISDLQARFNLNSLLDSGELDKENYERFKRLLTGLDLPVLIADAVVDWLDVNQTPMPAGAEDITYLGQETPYRVADSNMASSSELLYLLEVELGEKSWGLLKQYVCALPENTSINVNTVSSENKILFQSLAPGLTEKDAGDLLADRPSAGYSSVADFVKNAKKITGKNIKKTGLSVNSQYFLFDAHVKLGRSYSRQQSLVKRVSATDIRILQRIQGEI